MPAPLISKAQVLDRLAAVFREVGYDGATLSRLSAETGLVKASLYHYFPGGKADMAAAVLRQANLRVEQRALAPLRGPGAPVQRLEAMCTALDDYYAAGRDDCLLRLLSQGSARDRFQAAIQAAITDWRDAITEVLIEAGQQTPLARERAEDAIIQIQGALVVARGLGMTSPFSRTLNALPARLLAPVGPTE